MENEMVTLWWEASISICMVPVVGMAILAMIDDTPIDAIAVGAFSAAIFIPMTFAGVHSVVNLLGIFWHYGFDGLLTDLREQRLGLRVASTLLLVTAIQYLAGKSRPLRNAEKRLRKKHPKKDDEDTKIYKDRINKLLTSKNEQVDIVYDKALKNVAISGNIFFTLVTTALWLLVLSDNPSVVFAPIAWIIFFIIDDWVLLLHFKYEAPAAVTKLHNLRLYVAVGGIVFLTMIGAYDYFRWNAMAVSACIVLAGIYYINCLREEKEALEAALKKGYLRAR